MNTLNLIVHKEIMARGSNGCDQVLDRIEEIERTGTNVAHIRWDWKMRFDNERILRRETPKLVRGYDLVILYGSSRDSCVATAASIIQESGIPVAYDIAGTY